mgnify:CR=1 FL=1
MTKILVYDKKKFMYRFIKSNFERIGNFNVTKTDNQINFVHKIDYLIVTYYDESDIIFFADIYKKKKDIILLYADTNDVKRILEICVSLNSVNISNHKSEIFATLKNIIK